VLTPTKSMPLPMRSVAMSTQVLPSLKFSTAAVREACGCGGQGHTCDGSCGGCAARSSWGGCPATALRSSRRRHLTAPFNLGSIAWPSCAVGCARGGCARGAAHLVRVDGVRVEAIVPEVPVQLLGALLAAHKHQHGRPQALRQHLPQGQQLAALAAHEHQALLDVGGRAVALADHHAQRLLLHRPAWAASGRGVASGRGGV
jgi:hypothetical protein